MVLLDICHIYVLIYKCSLHVSYKTTEKFMKYKIGSTGYFYSYDSSYYTPRTQTIYAIFIGESGQMKLEKITPKLKYHRFLTARMTEYITKIDDWMIPSVNMIVFAYSMWGEFVFDAKKIKITNPTNRIAINLLSEKRFELQSGQTFKLKLEVGDKNDKSSSLHLLGVDESVRDFGNNNEITWNKLQNLIDQYRAKNNHAAVTGKFENRYDELEKFNAFIMTNAYITERKCDYLPKIANIEDYVNFKNETIGVGSKRQNKITITSDKIPKTFLYEDISGSELVDNESTRNLTAPELIGSYQISGFVFHPVHGLGIAENKRFTVIIRDSRRP